MKTPRVSVGIDLVSLEDFRKAVQRGGDTFLRRLFHPSESRGASVERLAGIFAAKEAAFKALALPEGNWHVVEVRFNDKGKPYLVFAPEYDTTHIVSCDLSISRCKEHVLALVVALMRG